MVWSFTAVAQKISVDASYCVVIDVGRAMLCAGEHDHCGIGKRLLIVGRATIAGDGRHALIACAEILIF